MIQMTLRVTKEDGSEQDHRVTPATVVAFERQFSTGIGKAFSTDQKAEHLYWLAWHATKGSGEIVRPFDEWLGGIADVAMVEQPSRP